MASLTGHAVEHLVRRGMKACGGHSAESDGARIAAANELLKNYELPGWGIAIIAVTVVIYALLLASVDYTVGDVVATLMMVETPTSEVTVVSLDEPDAPLEKAEKERLVDTEAVKVTPKLITQSARSTVRHLHYEAGFFSRWRGLGFSILYHTAIGFFVNFLTGFITLGTSFGVSRPFVSVAASVIFVRAHMAWTHAMIVAPESVKDKRWYQRIPSFESSKKLYFAAAVHGVAQQLTIYTPLAVYYLWDMPASDERTSTAYHVSRLGSVVLMTLVVAIGILLPALVTLVRMEASLLPEEYETIVPFDRSFGGKVVAPITVGNEIVGFVQSCRSFGQGTGVVGFVEAWRSFDRSARRRLLKLYLQLGAMQVGLVISLITTVFCQVALIMGDDFNVLVKAVTAKYRQVHAGQS